MEQNHPTAGIFTLGCKVNQYESEAIAERLTEEGFTVLPPEEVCDVYVINTCTVTAESDRKARQIIRRARGRNPAAYVLVTGCFSQTSPDDVAAIGGVDFVCGNAEKQAVVRAARDLWESGRKNPAAVVRDDPPDRFGFEPMKITKFDRTRAYVKIEDGCENRCAYCIIPSARGKVRSKPADEVVAEVTGLVAGGCREVVLTGIETASWGRDLGDADLADLLERVDAIPGIGRVRLGSLDPSLMKQPFVDRIARLPSLAPHFHLSIQSGSDSVLARMRRKYNSRMVLDGMERLRRAIPGVQFTTDVIVGFPGESEEEFRETLDLVKRARFLMIHVFPFSRRKGTEADRMPDQVPQVVKHRRARQLAAEQAKIRAALLDGMNGRPVNVLFEVDENGFSTGHTPDFVEVVCPSAEPLHGQIRQVRLLGNDGERCHGTLIPSKE